MGAQGCVGGILGFSSQAGTKVENCTNNADVVQAVPNAKELALGGIVGRTGEALDVIGCTNNGSVSYESADKPGSYLHIGGILAAAYKGCKVSACRNKGDISSCINQVNRIGGIVGTMNTNGLIENCINDGSVTVDQAENINWQAAGGILGFEEKGSAEIKIKVLGCTNNGAVTLRLNNTTTHANRAAAGGIVGTTCSNVEYGGNTNNGKVSAVNTGSTPVYLGGITGWYIKGAGYSSYDNVNNAEVANAAAGAAGGVIGNASIASCSVKGDTNMGIVSGEASNSGSIAGLAACALNSCAVGGVVNGTEVTDGNFQTLIQGSASTGTPVSCYFVGGSGPAAYVTASPAAVNFVAAGEAKEINVGANCGWTAVSSESWLTISAAEGDGNGSITLTAAENTASTQRTATVTLTSKTDASVTSTVTVTQAEHVDGLSGNQIASAADFKTFLAIASTLAAGDVIEMTADIDLAGEAIAPIPYFVATLDGKNHTISNFTIASSETSAGLFLVNKGTITNLKVGTKNGTSWDGATKISFASGVTGATAAGIVAVNSGMVENVSNYATVLFNAKSAASSSTSVPAVGGVVGHFDSPDSYMRNCHNYGEVSLTGTMTGLVAVGGVLGYVTPGGAKSTIESCSNNAAIVQTVVNAKELTLGGVVGRTGATLNVTNCTNTAEVAYRVTDKPGGYVHTAGIVGAAYFNCQITGCRNTGNIFSCINQVNRIGGIVGTMNTSGLIDNCTNEGSVTVDQAANANWQAVGGICGFEEKASETAPIKISGLYQQGRSQYQTRQHQHPRQPRGCRRHHRHLLFVHRTFRQHQRRQDFRLKHR
jgi:hypothetical protein